jgi:hypothetical protein
MPAVAAALLVCERARHVEGESVSLPVGEPARERQDVLIAKLFERLRGKGRSAATGAIDDQRPCTIGRRGLDARLQIPARDVDRTGDVPLLPLVALPHVDEDRVLRLEKSAG